MTTSGATKTAGYALPTIVRRRSGALLRGYRETAGITVVEAARLSGLSSPQITRIEQGRYKITPTHVRTLMDVAQVDDDTARAELERAAAESPRSGWWEPHMRFLSPALVDYIALENMARRMRVQHPVLIPGILQSPSYARAILSTSPVELSPERFDTLASIRASRQQILSRTASPVTLHAVVPEAAFLAESGDTSVTQEQARHLLMLGKLENVTIQVLPQRSGIGAAPTEAATLMDFVHPWPAVVHIDSRNGGFQAEDPEEVRQVEAKFEDLAKIALPVDVTREFLQDQLEEKTSS